jgi:hypothetical protein
MVLYILGRMKHDTLLARERLRSQANVQELAGQLLGQGKVP